MPAFDVIVRRRNANDTGTEEILVPYEAGTPLAFDSNGFPVSAGAVVKFASVALTDEQVLALPTTPIQLVAGVAGKVLVPLLAIVKSVIVETGAYTGIDTPSDLGLVYEEETTLIAEVDADAAGLLDTEGTNLIELAKVANSVPVAAAGLFVFSANALDFDDGNEGNSLVVSAWYVELDV